MKMIFLILAIGAAVTFADIHTKNTSMAHKPSRDESMTMQSNKKDLNQTSLDKNKTLIISFQLHEAIAASNC
jgi:hypothetical protein